MEFIINSSVYGSQKILIDEDDYDLVKGKSWWFIKTGNKIMPICRYNSTTISMHDFIMRNFVYDLIIHKDGNKLNNTRSNFRIIKSNVYQKKDDVIELRIDSVKFGEMTALFDVQYFDIVAKYKWSLAKRNKTFYAIAHSIEKNKEMILLHRLIFNSEGFEIDHINHNGLDNRQLNIRFATRAQNLRNTRIPITNTSGYKGVSFCKTLNKWRVQLAIKGKNRHGGYFLELKDAVIAYNELAKKHYNEYAYLNPIPHE